MAQQPPRTRNADTPGTEAIRRTTAARLGTALFWVVGGALHFVIPRQFESFVPPQLGRWRRELVVASAIAEIAGGIAVLPDRTRRFARWWLLATLVAVYPANINMTVNSRTTRTFRPPRSGRGCPCSSCSHGTPGAGFAS
jgi:uncharacterized membrane protein